MKRKPGTTVWRLQVRLDGELRELLERAAADEDRSINEQIAHIVKAWLLARRDAAPTPPRSATE